jgi:DNA-binding response OmpR family regulator
MDGIETILEMRREGSDVPIIAFSGGGRVPPDVLLSSAGALGAFETMQKPIDVKGLLATVERALARGPAPPDED